MKKIQLKPFAIIPSHSTSNAYTLFLAEVDGDRKLPIVIGEHEAQAIALDLENIKPPRPLTHELIKNILIPFGLTVENILIEDFHEGIFYSTISIFSLSDGETKHKIDSRTSDAVALALKFNSPIYTTEKVLEMAGIIIEQTEFDVKEEKEDTKLENLNIEKLMQLLKEAEGNEEYEEASKIMDEINRRKGEK